MGQRLLRVKTGRLSVNPGHRPGHGAVRAVRPRTDPKPGQRAFQGSSRRAIPASIFCLAGLALGQVAAADTPRIEQILIGQPLTASGPAPGRANATEKVRIVAQQQGGIAPLIEKARQQGRVRVIVGLKLPDGFTPEGDLPSPDAVQRQRGAIAAARQALLASLQGLDATVYARWRSLPQVAIQASGAALSHLADSPYVTTIQEDTPVGTTAPE